MHNFKILKLTKNSPESVKTGIIQLIWDEWSRHFESFVELTNEIEQCVNDSNYAILYAYDDLTHEICGTISLIENDLTMFNHLRPWLANFYVQEKYRGKSIGSKLYDQMLEIAFNELKYNEIYLYTSNAAPYLKKNWTKYEQFSFMGERFDLLMLTQDL